MTIQELEEFGEYQGSTPCPDDFEVFWSARMAEADHVPLSYTIKQSNEILSSALCRCQELWFTGMDGAKVYAKYLLPICDHPVPLVLQFHGYPGASRSWLEQLSFVGMGMAVLAMECPGQGGHGDDLGGYTGVTVSGHIIAGLDGPTEKMYYVRLYQNIRILCRIVRKQKEIDLKHIYVNGASQGGALGLACAALNSDLICRSAILYPFLSDFRLVWELGADEVAYEGLRYYSRWFDPDGEKSERWFHQLGYIDSKNFAPLVRCPVLFGTGLADFVCPPQTQCAVYNRLQCPKQRYLYPGFAHEEIQEFDDLLLDFFCGEEIIE